MFSHIGSENSGHGPLVTWLVTYDFMWQKGVVEAPSGWAGA